MSPQDSKLPARKQTAAGKSVNLKQSNINFATIASASKAKEKEKGTLKTPTAAGIDTRRCIPKSGKKNGHYCGKLYALTAFKKENSNHIYTKCWTCRNKIKTSTRRKENQPLQEGFAFCTGHQEFTYKGVHFDKQQSHHVPVAEVLRSGGNMGKVKKGRTTCFNCCIANAMIRQDTETKRYTHKVEFFQKKNGATKPDGTPDTKLDMEKVWCQGIPEVHKDAAAMALQSMDCQFDVINKKLWKLLEKDEIDQAEFYGLFHNDHKSDIRHLKKGLVKDVLVSDLPEEYEKTEIRCGNCHHFKTLRMDLKIRARFVKVNGKAHAILIDAKTGKDLDDNGDEEEESDSSKEDEESDSSKDDEDIDSSKDNEDYNDD